MQATAIQNIAPEAQVLTISSSTGEGVRDLLRLLRKEVEAYRQVETETSIEEVSSDIPVISLAPESSTDVWTVEPEDEGYRVHGEKIEKFARRTNFDQPDAVNRLRDIMRKTGILHELMRQGATSDTIIYIGQSEFTLLEQ